MISPAPLPSVPRGPTDTLHGPRSPGAEDRHGYSPGIDAERADALRLQAQQAVAAGRASDAERLLRRAILLAPAAVPAHVDLISLLSRLGRAEEALALLGTALTRQPDCVWALSLKAAVLETERRTDEALEVHRALLEPARVVGRPLHDPACERQDFPAYGLGLGGHRPIELPRLKGEWLIYLRSDDRVLSEPWRLVGDPLTEHGGRLVREGSRAGSAMQGKIGREPPNMLARGSR